MCVAVFRRDGYPPSARRLSELLLSTQVVENGGCGVRKAHSGRIQGDACMAAGSAAASAGDSRLDLAKTLVELCNRVSRLSSLSTRRRSSGAALAARLATSPQVIQLGSRERQRRGAARLLLDHRRRPRLDEALEPVVPADNGASSTVAPEPQSQPIARVGAGRYSELGVSSRA